MTLTRFMRAFGAFVLCAALSIGFLFLAGCTKQERTSHHSASRPGHMSVYHSPNASGEWLYWYVLMNSNGSTYYYSSPTVLTGGYSNVPFTRADAANPLPAEVTQTTAIAQEDVPVADEPAAASVEELAADQAADAAEMHADEGAEAADVSPSSESSSGDSGSSDSGSSDSGGGGGSSD